MLSKVYDEVDKEEAAFKALEQRLKQYPVEIVRDSSPKIDYYKVGGIEVIDYIKAKLTSEQYRGYLLGNIYKYSGRCQYKGEYEKDITKLSDYVKWLKEFDGANY